MVWKVGAIVAGGYAALLGVAKLAYRTALYPAPRRGMTEAPPGANLKRYVADDSEPVQVLLFDPPDNATGATVVLFHGNGETIADSVSLGRGLLRRGVGFAAVEYRGYGASEGNNPTEQGLYLDASAALSGLIDDGIAADKITLWGHSLGSGVAVEMAARSASGEHVPRLVLTAPYTSIPAVAARIMPLLPMGAIISDRYDSLAKASALQTPTLIIHGTRDRVVPYDMGEKLAATFPQGELLTVEGVGHNDLFVERGDELLDRIADHAKKH